MTPTPPPPAAKSSTKTVLIILGAVALGGCCIISGLAAIAVPNFMRYQQRSMQSECKINLKSYFTGQKIWQAEHDEFAVDSKDTGFSPDLTRYTYFLGSGQVVAATNRAAKGSVSEGELAATGVKPVVDAKHFTVACAANLDGDATLDVWSISSEERTVGGVTVPPGQPFNDVDDLKN